jgi:hypothetical protein
VFSSWENTKNSANSKEKMAIKSRDALYLRMPE